MSKVYHLSVSGPAENQKYKDAIAQIIKECLAYNADDFDTFLSDGDSTLFKTEDNGKSFTARKDLFPTLFNASANVESANAKSEDIKEEKNLNTKPLTEKEKALFGTLSVTKDGRCYHVGDFVRAISGGTDYCAGAVGTIMEIDPSSEFGTLCVYFAGYVQKELWVPYKDFEVVPRPTFEEGRSPEEVPSHKYLTDREKGLFGGSYTDAEGTTYHAGDFVRALVAGDCYSCDDVGIVVTTDSKDPLTPLLIYFGDAEEECWVPCKDFEKVYWS